MVFVRYKNQLNIVSFFEMKIAGPSVAVYGLCVDGKWLGGFRNPKAICSFVDKRSTMRILIVHNYYQHPGGEDTVVSQEHRLLSETEEVDVLTFRNRRGWKGLIQTALSPWNFWAARSLRKAIRQFKPDVIHVHNLHYAVGPLAIRVAKRMGIPVVMTLHNYRLLCPSATLFYQGGPFTDSVTAAFPWRAVANGVHSNSVIKTFWLAATNWMHRRAGTWKMVDRYLALTPFAREKVLSSSLGLDERQVTVKQNFLVAEEVPSSEREDFFLFVGRLSEEKGIRVLLEAFAEDGSELIIVGDGPLKELVARYAVSHPNIRFVGSLSREDVAAMLSRCTALVFPSVWYEGMPMTIIEAFATSTAVIASDLGAMPSMVSEGKNGLLFQPGSTPALRACIKRWQSFDPDTKRAIGRGARQDFEKKYSEETNKALLMAIYHSVLRESLRAVR